MQVDELQQRLGRHAEIVAAYLFGSAVNDKLTPMSDIDVALLLREETQLPQELDVVFFVMSHIQEVFHREPDVIVLNRIRDLPFLHQVLSTGRVIYESDRDTHRGFVGRTLIDYLDFEPVYQMALKNYSRSLHRGRNYRPNEKFDDSHPT